MRLAAAAVTGFFLGCVIYGCSHSKPAKVAQLKPDKQRHAAPDFALKDSDGRVVHLSDYKGKVLLLDFWATWCGPCRIEIPWFMEFQRKLKDQGFSVLGVSMDDDGWDSVKPFASQMAINYRIVLGDDSTADQYGGIEALPTTFLIDRQGKIAAVHVGLASKSEILNGIEQLLETPARAANRPDGASLSAGIMGAR